LSFLTAIVVFERDRDYHCQLAYSDPSAGGFGPEEPRFRWGEIDDNWKNLPEVSKGIRRSQSTESLPNLRI